MKKSDDRTIGSLRPGSALVGAGSNHRTIGSSDHLPKSREDFVRFRLRPEAPDYVAFGGARFSGVFARAQEPFEVTHGEWKVFFERTGFFEEL
jgi:hypothetical protein